MQSYTTILTCIVPFAPKAFTRDWSLACDYLRQTVGSLINSLDPRIAVVVVCHDNPNLSNLNDPRVHFIQATHQPPPLGAAKDPVLATRDWLLKIRFGWQYAKVHFPSKYVMKMDADDFLSRNVVGFLAACDSYAGLKISEGLVWNSGSRYFLEATEYFNLLCGSSVIVRSDVAEIEFNPQNVCESIPEYASQALAGFQSSLLINELHGNADKAFEINQLKMGKVPFRAGIYRIGNINSHSGRTNKIHSFRLFLGRIRRTRLLTKSLRKEYALY